jgi:hypothetical protein
MKLSVYLILMAIGLVALICTAQQGPIIDGSWLDVARTVISLCMFFLTGWKVANWSDSLKEEEGDQWDY